MCWLKFKILCIMDLQRIKIEAEKKGITFKSIAASIDMSEGNLHRCVRENRIAAQDLEKIARLLKVSVGTFFDESAITSVTTSGDYSPASDSGDITLNVGASVLTERIKAMEALIKEKDERIKEKDERISDLRDLLNMKKRDQ